MNANGKLEFDLSNPDSKLDHIKCLKEKPYMSRIKKKLV